MKRTFSRVPPLLVWSSLPRERTTQVGPFVSEPWAGEVPSEMAKCAKRPFTEAPHTWPK